MALRIGLDAGSKTIKLVVLDEQGNAPIALYQRHQSDIKTTLIGLLNEALWRYGDQTGTIVITGSAGIGLAEALGLPFIQEVMATTEAIRTQYPQADAFIELGGEDAKIVYLSGEPEQRMNASCAGGTGGFIDTIAYMLGVRSEQISSLAMRGEDKYPIASRCVVFAQTDVRPLLNAGAKKCDIAASVLNAVVRQTLGGLACGRPVEGQVVFLGGPIEHIPDLVRRFRIALGLNVNTGIKPEDAHLFTAKGAALSAHRVGEIQISLQELLSRVKCCDRFEDDLEHLEPLFEDDDELDAFVARHNSFGMAHADIRACQGPVFVGLDAGSTAFKMVALDSEGRIVFSDYQSTEGDVLAAASEMLQSLYIDLSKAHSAGSTRPYIARAVVTGYGEDLLKQALGMDFGVVETSAHVRAAKQMCPDVSFVLDIGGQDMKAIWVKDGKVTDAVLNEACSSGCGSFVEGTAHSLKVSLHRFTKLALMADHPIDLGTKCTVFMTSRVKHAQKIGATIADISAGIAYSVVHNALYRIIGRPKVVSLGTSIVVQGGTFKSDAVLRAFEKTVGVEVQRPREAHLMGAIGAALLGKDNFEYGSAEDRDTPSSLISLEQTRKLEYTSVQKRCSGCENNCEVTLTAFDDSRVFLSGNRCSRAYEVFPECGLPQGKGGHPPNMVALQQKLLSHFNGFAPAKGKRLGCTLGIPNTLRMYGQLPFWRELLVYLGFDVVVADNEHAQEMRDASAESIASESACFPAKLTNQRVYRCMELGAQAVFMPSYQRKSSCAVLCGYASSLADSVPAIRNGRIKLISPLLPCIELNDIIESPEAQEAVREALNAYIEQVRGRVNMISEQQFREALAFGIKAHQYYRDTLTAGTHKALTWLHAVKSRRAVVLACHPYQLDASVLHDVDNVLESLGFAVFVRAGLRTLGYGTAGETSPESTIWAISDGVVDFVGDLLDDPQISIVGLQSFGCMYGALEMDALSKRLVTVGKPFALLKIDEMVDTAHIRIRLRTLAETIQQRFVDGRFQGVDPSAIRDYPARVRFRTSSFCSTNLESGVDAPERILNDALLLRMDRETWVRAQEEVPSDLCFTAAMLTAKVMEAADSHVSAQRFAVPLVCEKCVREAAARLTAKKTGRPIQLALKSARDGADTIYRISNKNLLDSKAYEKALRVGILGNILMCYDSFMNEGLADRLELLGCVPVFPDPALVETDDVRYLDQMERFRQQGVDVVLYIQSFGCVKGHVASRGASHEMATRFPDLPITIIDYSPDSSPLNRENRIRLAVEAALDKHPEARKAAEDLRFAALQRKAEKAQVKFEELERAARERQKRAAKIREARLAAKERERAEAEQRMREMGRPVKVAIEPPSRDMFNPKVLDALQQEKRDEIKACVKIINQYKGAKDAASASKVAQARYDLIQAKKDLALLQEAMRAVTGGFTWS